MPATVNNMVLQVETEDLQMKRVIGDGTNQKIIEVVLDVPTEKPDIEKILKVDVKVKPDSDIRVIKDKVIIDGRLDIDTLYVGETNDGDQPVHSMEHTIKFGAYVDVPGAEEDMDADVDVEVEDVNWDDNHWDDNHNRGCRLRVTIVLKLTVRVIDMSMVEVVTDMRLVPAGAMGTTTGTMPTGTTIGMATTPGAATTGTTSGMVTIPGTNVSIPIEGGPIEIGNGNTGVGTTNNSTATAGVSQTVYTVVSGDTLGAIAVRYGTTVAAIARANNIADVNRISIGQQLIIPSRS